MANVKISELPAASTNLGTSDVLVCVQSSTTKSVTVARLGNSLGVGDNVIDKTLYENSPSTNNGGISSGNEYITLTSTSDFSAGQLIKLTQSAKTYHLVTQVTSTQVHLSGPSIDNGTPIVNDSLATLNDARGIPVDVVFSGAYCLAQSSTNTLIADENKTSLRWTGPTARLVYVAAKHNTAESGSTKPAINVAINGTTSAMTSDITLANTNWTEVANGGMVQGQSQVEFGEIIEVKLVNNGSNGDARDLTVSMVFAVEDY